MLSHSSHYDNNNFSGAAAWRIESLIPESDWHLVSPNSVIHKSINNEVRRIWKIINQLRSSFSIKNSSSQSLRKCIGKGLENMDLWILMLGCKGWKKKNQTNKKQITYSHAKCNLQGVDHCVHRDLIRKYSEIQVFNVN